MQQRGRELTDMLVDIQRLYQAQAARHAAPITRLARYRAKLLGHKLPMIDMPALPDPAPLQAELNQVNAEVIALLNRQLGSLERQLSSG